MDSFGSSATCLLCNRLLGLSDRRFGLCKRCQGLLEHSLLSHRFSSWCTYCSAPLGEFQSVCSRCHRDRYPISVKRLFPYCGIPAALLRLWKFEQRRLLSRLFSQYVSLSLSSGPGEQLLLVPVPCSPDSRRKRGYDPMLDVAGQLALQGYHVLPLIKRLEHERQQLKHQDSLGRIRTAREVYRLDQRWLSRCGGSSRIILLDDIMTTGATLRACCEQLKGSVEGEIEAVVVLMD